MGIRRANPFRYIPLNSVSAGTNTIYGNFKAPSTGLTVSKGTGVTNNPVLNIGDSTTAATLTFGSGAALTVSNATVNLSSSSCVDTNTFTINDGGTLSLNFAGQWDVSGKTFNLNSGGTLYFKGNGSETGAPALTNSGTINLNGGTIKVDTNPANWEKDLTNRTFIASSSDTMKIYVLEDGATIQVDGTDKTARISANIQNKTGFTPGSITKTGTGTLQLYKPTYTSETILKEGTIEIIAEATGKLPGGVSMQGGTLINNATGAAANEKYKINEVSDGTNTIQGNFKAWTTAATDAFTINGGSTLNIGTSTDAASLEAAGYVQVEGTGSTLVMTNGTLTAHGYTGNLQMDSLNVKNGATFKMHGGTVNLDYGLRLGTETVGYMEMSGGTINLNGEKSTFIGGNAQGIATISGGTLNTPSLYVGWANAGGSALTITGGKVVVRDSTLGLVFGDCSGTITISGGTIAVNRMGCKDGKTNPTSTMNIIGNQITWTNAAGTGNVGKFELNTNQTLNLTVTSGGFSTLVADTVNVQGAVTVNYAGGLGVLPSTVDLVRGTTSFSMTQNPTSSQFTLSKTSNGFTITGLTAPESEIRNYGGTIELVTAAASGWFTIPESCYDLKFNLDIDSTSEEAFAKWLNEETSFNHEANYDSTTQTLTLGSLPKLGAGDTFFWDFTGFSGGEVKLIGASFHVPEPATWVLLLLGILGVCGKKRIMNNE